MLYFRVKDYKKLKNMKITRENVRESLRNPHVQRIGTAFVALVVIGSVAYFGTLLNRSSKAATPGTMYVTPATGTYAPGAQIVVDVREDSGLDSVNAVQAAVTYNAAQLRFDSISPTGSGFPVILSDSTATAGQVRFARGTDSGTAGVSGDQQIARLTFTVLATSGTSTIGIDSTVSAIVKTSDNSNIMTNGTPGIFSIQYPAPTLGTVSPTSGLTGGGTVLTLTGTNFRSGATVTVGGTAATAVTLVSATQLTATTPSHAAGVVSVVVTNADGQTATKTNAFTYVLPAPTISTVSPVSGTTAGGNTVTITGTNFRTGAVVKFGTTTATSTTFVSATQVTAVVPARAAGGAVDVSVTNTDGQVASKTGAYTYISNAPVVSSLSASFGFALGGMPVTITGQNFQSGATVSIGGTAATSVVFVNATTLTAVTPTHATGTVSVAVTNPDAQTGTLANSFTYRVTGDANGDGKPNALDYSAYASHDGQVYPPADFNGDGVVGVADFSLLLGNWIW